MKKQKRYFVGGMVLYAIAGLLVVYTGWAFIHCAGYIREMINSGQLAFAGNEYDIINFYMGNCAQYFIFAALLAGMGLMMHKNPTMASQSEVSASTRAMKPDEDNELDEWFDEMQSSGENGEK